MRHIIVLLAAFAALAGCTHNIHVAAPGESDHPTINTSGQATVYVIPDKVVVNLGVVTHAATLDPAKSKNDADAARLVKAISALGVPAKDFATDNVQVQINYENFLSWAIEGYTVRRSYAITLKDTSLLEKLVHTALSNGANEIQNVSFETTELRKHRDHARQMAIRAAKEKAVALARELDATVGKPRVINETDAYNYSGAYWGYYWGGYSPNNANNSNNSNNSNSGGSTEAGAREVGETMPLGQIAVSASVTVTFDLN
jgi:uncharacterized protein